MTLHSQVRAYPARPDPSARITAAEHPVGLWPGALHRPWLQATTECHCCTTQEIQHGPRCEQTGRVSYLSPGFPSLPLSFLRCVTIYPVWFPVCDYCLRSFSYSLCCWDWRSSV